jgi:ADP-heptose:LPS heptosyltransferase
VYKPARDPFAPGFLQEIGQNEIGFERVRKVAILKASRIGDFINTTPALRALRNALPEAEFSLISLPMLRPLVERLPYIDRYLDFPGYPGMAEQFFDPARTLAFFQEMQAEHFDLAVQFQGSGVYSNPFLLMLGARYTAGCIREGDPPGRLSAAIPWPTTGHEIRRNLALSTFLGAQPITEQTDFPLLPEDHQAADRLLANIPRPWIGIHPSARDVTRRWPLDRFAQAAALLQSQHGGTVLLLGEAQDAEAMQAVLEQTGAPYHNLAGRTSLPETGAILTRLAVFLTNDTGPAHIAYALRVPTVTIFGGGDPQRNGPLLDGPFRVIAHPVPCRPCETGTCPIGLQCLLAVTVEEVVAKANEVIS